MKMPGPERAIVDIAKVRDYCLSLDHPRGRHKARVFASRLGFTVDSAEALRHRLLMAAHFDNAIPGEQDLYGQRYIVDVMMTGPAGSGMVRST